MSKCTNKNFFVALTSSFDSLVGTKDNYIYPLNKETVLKSKREIKKMENIDYQKTYIKSFEECKFMESNSKEAIKLEFRPYQSIRNENDKIIKEFNYINQDIIKLILDDNSYFEIIEDLIKNNKDLYKNPFNYNYQLYSFYMTFVCNVPEFKDILFDKLDKRGFLNTSILVDMIYKFNPTIEELDKYMPKKLIPTKDNYLSIIEKYGNFNENKVNQYNVKILDLIELATIDPRFAIFVSKIEILKENNMENSNFYSYLSKKNWKCFINSGFIFEHDFRSENRLKKNPCLIIFYPEKYHNEERYLNALKNDITCYPYLNKKYITSSVEKYYLDNLNKN